jgi:signal peptidase I
MTTKNKNYLKDENKEKKNAQNSTKKYPSEEKESTKGVGFFVELAKTIILAILIVMPIKIFVMQPFFVQGKSMEPNFHDGEYLIVRELGYKTTAVAAGNKKFFTIKPFKTIKRGEVIVFRNPNNPSQFFIKRTIGLPGEKVVINNGKVRIYNKQHPKGFILDENKYLPANFKTGHSRSFSLESDEYVVLGDNRSNSSDSRYWGVLKEDLIVGRVSLRAWPLNNFKIF